MAKRFILTAVLLCIALLAGAERRALIIGNANYSEGRLKNPVKDALAVDAVLKNLDFITTVRTDLDRRKFDEEIDRFIRSLRPQDEAFFYYSGHGVQIDGENYLLPIGKDFNDPADVKYDAINANKITEKLAQVSVSLIVLDACRDNPFQLFRTSTNKGMAIMNLRPTGQFVIYSTASGQVASDGSGELSPFTQAFVTHAPTPNITIEEMMRNIIRDVRTVSNNRQSPYSYGSFDSAYYLALAPIVIEEERIEPPKPEKKKQESEVELATGDLRISTDHAISIWVNGKKEESLKPGHVLNLKNLVIGSYTVEAITTNAKYGYEVQVKDSQQTILSLQASNMNPKKYASLTVDSDPSPCKLTIEGYEGLELQTPFTIVDPQAKTYNLTFSLKPYDPVSHRISSNPKTIKNYIQTLIVPTQKLKLSSDQSKAIYTLVNQDNGISHSIKGNTTSILPEGKYQVQASSFGYYSKSVPLKLAATDSAIEQRITFEPLPKQFMKPYHNWNKVKTVSIIGTLASLGFSTYCYFNAEKQYKRYKNAWAVDEILDERQQFVKAQNLFNASVYINILPVATYIWGLNRSQAAKKRINAEAQRGIK